MPTPYKVFLQPLPPTAYAAFQNQETHPQMNMTKCLTLSAALIATIMLSLPTAAAAIEEKDYAGYLFVYFTGNSMSDESIHFAISRDGYNYHALNNNRPVLDSRTNSLTGSVCDPHILSSADGVCRLFYKTEGNGIRVATTRSLTSGQWHESGDYKQQTNDAVIRLPETDEWHIVYHRINKHYAKPELSPGTHRDVCIDGLTFDKFGRNTTVDPSE